MGGMCLKNIIRGQKAPCLEAQQRTDWYWSERLKYVDPKRL